MLHAAAIPCLYDWKRWVRYTHRRLQHLKGEEALGKLLVVGGLLRSGGIQLVMLVDKQNFGVAGDKNLLIGERFQIPSKNTCTAAGEPSLWQVRVYCCRV